MRTLVAIQTAFTWSFLCGVLLADDWPQWRGPGRDGVWHESGVVERFETSQIKIRWRTRISSGYSGPTVADGRVYVSDYVSEPEQRERVHSLDWKTGRTVWTYAYPCDYGSVGFPAGPRACITIDDGRAYALGTVGHFHCFDGATGKVLWQKDLVDEYKIRLLTWGIAPAPLVEGELVILQVGGADGACIVALDKRTGDERWRAIDEPTSYSSPIVVKQAGRRVLVCWTGASVSGLDPNTGSLYWRHPWTHDDGWIDCIATPAFGSCRLFLSCTQDGVRMLRLDPDALKVELLWKHDGPARRHGTSLHAVISTPWMADDFLYGIGYFGQLRCLDAETGEQMWEDHTATSQVIWGMGHLVRNGDKTWILVPPGEFDRGSTDAATERLSQEATKQKMPAWYVERLADERPRHRVKITRPFYMSQYEVTVGQFRNFLKWGDYHPDRVQDGRNGWGLNTATGKLENGAQYTWEDPGFPQTDQHPVVNVSWADAVAYCDYLQSAEGDECRLPTEAEWEYACRAGTTTFWHCGDDEATLQEYAWFGVNSGGKTHPVGELLANAFGLYDMHGNVFEWCADYWATGYYAESPSNDPSGPSTGSHRVDRGGYWGGRAGICRSAGRGHYSPDRRGGNLGFRLASVLVDK